MSESSTPAASGAAASDATEPSPKRVKSQPPDVVVAVGRGEAQVEFECYGTLLSFSSEVFDTMLSTNMREKNDHRIELPDKDPGEWKMFYEFVEDRNAKVETYSDETKTRARILLPWFHEFQMTALVKECDDALHKEGPTRCWVSYSKGKRKEIFQLCHELLSMSYVYGLPRTQKSASESLSSAIMHDYELFDLDSIKNIIPLLKNNVMSILDIEDFLPDELVKDTNGHHLSRELREEKIKSLADNDLLPFLIHSGIRSRIKIRAAKQETYEAKKALAHFKNELYHVVDNLPTALAAELPEARRMPTPGTEKIDAAAQRCLEQLKFKRWRQQEDNYLFWTNSGNQSSREAVGNMIQVPPTYNH